MSYSIYYTIRKNYKCQYPIDTLFFGTQVVYDYQLVPFTPIFDSYDECLAFIKDKKILDCHIRREIETGGGIMVKDYKTWFNVKHVRRFVNDKEKTFNGRFE